MNTDNIVEFVNNLTVVVQTAVLIPDQSVQNVQVISSLLMTTVLLISLPVISLQVTELVIVIILVTEMVNNYS